MSLKGTQCASVVMSHCVLNPGSDCKICCASVTQLPAPAAFNAMAMAGFSPEGRKKFVSAAETQGAPVLGLMPHGAAPAPTCSGPAAAFEVGSLKAACQLFSRKSPRVVLALMGRFRCRPPLKL